MGGGEDVTSSVKAAAVHLKCTKTAPARSTHPLPSCSARQNSPPLLAFRPQITFSGRRRFSYKFRIRPVLFRSNPRTSVPPLHSRPVAALITRNFLSFTAHWRPREHLKKVFVRLCYRRKSGCNRSPHRNVSNGIQCWETAGTQIRLYGDQSRSGTRLITDHWPTQHVSPTL